MGCLSWLGHTHQVSPYSDRDRTHCDHTGGPQQRERMGQDSGSPRLGVYSRRQSTAQFLAAGRLHGAASLAKKSRAPRYPRLPHPLTGSLFPRELHSAEPSLASPGKVFPCGLGIVLPVLRAVGWTPVPSPLVRYNSQCPVSVLTPKAVNANEAAGSPAPPRRSAG